MEKYALAFGRFVGLRKQAASRVAAELHYAAPRRRLDFSRSSRGVFDPRSNAGTTLRSRVSCALAELICAFKCGSVDTLTVGNAGVAHCSGFNFHARFHEPHGRPPHFGFESDTDKPV